MHFLTVSRIISHHASFIYAENHIQTFNYFISLLCYRDDAGDKNNVEGSKF